MILATLALSAALEREPARRPIPAAAAIRSVRDLGRAPANTIVHLGVLLRYRHATELPALIAAQGDRRSPYFHHFLTNSQWNAYFAPDASSVLQAASALSRAGFRIARVPANRGMILADAPAATVERYFQTEIHRFAIDGKATYGNIRQAVVPRELQALAVSVSGLDAVTQPHFALHPGVRTVIDRQAMAQGAVRKRAASTTRPVGEFTPAPNPNPEPTLVNGTSYTIGQLGGWGPVTIATSYDYPVMHGYGGVGHAVGDLINADFADSDEAAYISQFQIPHTGRIIREPVAGDSTGASSGAALESTTDVETITGLAPGSDYYEYLLAGPYELDVENGYNQADSDNVVDVVNSSLGYCESQDPAAAFDFGYLAMQGSAKGITFTAATGDSGALVCSAALANGVENAFPGVFTPASSDYFLAVGGSDLVANPLNGSYLLENGYELGGGGVSMFLSQPSWQASTPGTSALGRTVPDISMAAGGFGFSTIDGGTSLPNSGTSIASALMAALIAEINETQNSRNGWINPSLYQIQNTQGYAWAFHDVVAGTNGTQLAGPGYDQLTGIGSPLGWELAGELNSTAIATPAPAPSPSPTSSTLPTLLPPGKKIYVTNHSAFGPGGPRNNPSVTVYMANASGNTAPVATLAGSSTALGQVWYPAVDSTGTLYVSDQNTGTTSGTVTEYSQYFNGNYAPKRTISGVRTPTGTAVDALNDLYVATPDSIDVYAPGESGRATPIRTISGSNTGLLNPYQIFLDALGNQYVAEQNAVYVFPAGANGNVAPTVDILGNASGLQDTFGVAADSGGNIYATNTNLNTVEVFTAATVSLLGGNVVPTLTVTSPSFNQPWGIFIDSNNTVYVANRGNNSIAIFSSIGFPTGIASAVISGSATGLDNPTGVTVR
jgi:subtilase family serine protease